MDLPWSIELNGSKISFYRNIVCKNIVCDVGLTGRWLLRVYLWRCFSPNVRKKIQLALVFCFLAHRTFCFLFAVKETICWPSIDFVKYGKILLKILIFEQCCTESVLYSVDIHGLGILKNLFYANNFKSFVNSGQMVYSLLVCWFNNVEFTCLRKDAFPDPIYSFKFNRSSYSVCVLFQKFHQIVSSFSTPLLRG